MPFLHNGSRGSCHIWVKRYELFANRGTHTCAIKCATLLLFPIGKFSILVCTPRPFRAAPYFLLR